MMLGLDTEDTLLAVVQSRLTAASYHPESPFFSLFPP